VEIRELLSRILQAVKPARVAVVARIQLVPPQLRQALSLKIPMMASVLKPARSTQNQVGPTSRGSVADSAMVSGKTKSGNVFWTAFISRQMAEADMWILSGAHSGAG
jgi:PhoPQ-activated pathogenicity-related protein